MKGSDHQSQAVTPETHHSYLKRARSILRQFSQAHDGVDPEEEPEWFESWFNNHFLAERGKATQRQYRAAVRYYIEFRGGRTVLSIREGKEQREWESDRGIDRRFTKPSGTSSGKAKHINPRELVSLCGALRSTRSKSAHLAADLLIAGCQFGLRPSEWAEAQFTFFDRPTDATECDSRLVVRNAKATQGRSFGSHRTLHFSRGSIEPTDLKVCMRCNLAMKVRALKRRRERQSGDEDADPCGLRAIQQSLARARKLRGYKRKITLYSARHQFAANAKAAGLKPIVIAALMGHGSDETAAQHYGKRRSGRRGRALGVEPSKEDVEAVAAMNAPDNSKEKDSSKNQGENTDGENHAEDNYSDDNLMMDPPSPSSGPSTS
ncbi:hypothetical protein ABGV17_07465 [Guyparkeria sp. GHLCS8-2]|uniref:hypothetical protein n=1 Tax=Guyparkeria halopsychrophila TaxID=3139421 RepID=UPI0037C5EAA1